MSFSAFYLAELILFLSLKLSSSNSLRLCSLSAKLIERQSLSLSNFLRIYPHSCPTLHLSLNWLLCSLSIATLYLILFFSSISWDIPVPSSSYFISICNCLYCLAQCRQISKPCFRPFLTLLERDFKDIFTTIIFL